MSYSTISSDYWELQLDCDGEIVKSFEDKVQPHIEDISHELCSSFNDAKLEEYLDDDLKAKIKSIRMSKTRKTDKYGRPYFRITFETYPGIHLYRSIKDRLDDYVSAQFCDGWGEGFFYPNSFVAKDGTRIAVQ